jgi:hypothetical protein
LHREGGRFGRAGHLRCGPSPLPDRGTPGHLGEAGKLPRLPDAFRVHPQVRRGLPQLRLHESATPSVASSMVLQAIENLDETCEPRAGTETYVISWHVMNTVYPLQVVPF